MDILVTTPKSEMANAAQEAADAILRRGGEYFRRFPRGRVPDVKSGDRCYYVEDGFVRGYALITRGFLCDGMVCDATGRRWDEGFYIVMEAASWRWIRPLPMRGFQGFRYASRLDAADGQGVRILAGNGLADVHEIGNWLDPRPRSCRVCGCTDRHGCPPPAGPCSWVEDDLCLVCAAGVAVGTP